MRIATWNLAPQDDNPDALVIWAGDFNQSLVGPTLTGSAAGREALARGLDGLGFTAWNAGERHARAGMSWIVVKVAVRNGAHVAEVRPATSA